MNETVDSDLIVDVQNGNESAFYRLLTKYSSYITSIAKRYYKYRFGCELSDIIQEARIGFYKAVKRFDISKGVPLLGYAKYYINQCIALFYKNNSRMIRLPISVQLKLKDSNDTRLLAKRTETVTLDAIPVESPAFGYIEHRYELLGSAMWLDRLLTETLSERARLILIKLYGLYGGKEHTLEQVAGLLDCVKENVRLIKNKSLQTLKERICA